MSVEQLEEEQQRLLTEQQGLLHERSKIDTELQTNTAEFELKALLECLVKHETKHT